MSLLLLLVLVVLVVEVMPRGKDSGTRGPTKAGQVVTSAGAQRFDALDNAVDVAVAREATMPLDARTCCCVGKDRV